MSRESGCRPEVLDYPAASSERRPAVIVSNDRANATADRLGRGVVTVVPVTGSIDRVFPFQTLLPAGLTGLRLHLQL